MNQNSTLVYKAYALLCSTTCVTYCRHAVCTPPAGHWNAVVAWIAAGAHKLGDQTDE